MDSVKIYLSGGMTGLSYDDSIKWRNKIKDAIKFGDYNLGKTPIFFNPPEFYSPEHNYHKSQREAMEFDLYELRNSNVVIVNFNAPNSIGTAMELMLAKEYHIPVIGINKDGYDLHPWLLECCTRICDSMAECVEYIAEYFLW